MALRVKRVTDPTLEHKGEHPGMPALDGKPGREAQLLMNFAGFTCLSLRRTSK
jgi:hypothetical protein